MSKAIRFRIRPVYHGSELLVEIMDDHREEGFPNIGLILRDALGATQLRHPEGLDDPHIAMSQDRYFGYWRYPGGHYEIDDDIWGLFVSAKINNTAVIADVERVLTGTGHFVKEPVDFAQFK